ATDVAEQHRHRALLAAQADRLLRLGDSLSELRREEPLEVAPREQLALDALRELAVLDGHRGNTREGDTQLEILVAEAVRRRHVVDVEDAEHAVLTANERAADCRANLLHEHGLAAEADVLAGVVRENRDLVAHGGSCDGARYGPRRVAAAGVTGD